MSKEKSDISDIFTSAERFSISTKWYGNKDLPTSEQWIGEIEGDSYRGFVESGESKADCIIQLGLSLMVRELYEAEKQGKPKPAYAAKYSKSQQKEQFSREDMVDFANWTENNWYLHSIYRIWHSYDDSDNRALTTDQLLTEYLNSKTKPI